MTGTLYFLNVDLKVTDPAAFETAVSQFLKAGGFSSVEDSGDLHFVSPVSLLRVDKAADNDPEPIPQYVHLWSVPDIGGLDLAELMRDSRDSAAYNAIDVLVSSERQEFIFFDMKTV